MNDYDDSEDYSSTNSFRARSNTWPLNRPDLAVPNSVCIDETLPEIELEEDDLFTTNENWTTGLVDHDIMSWDPILYAQSHHHHHHNNSHHLYHHNQHQPSHNHLSQATSSDQQQQEQHLQQSVTSLHEETNSQLSTNLAHQQLHQLHQHHTTAITAGLKQQSIAQQHSLPLHQTPQPQLESLLNSGSSPINGNNLSEEAQAQHQLTPQHHQQTLNSNHCLDSEDPNEYHLQQLHHLSLDNNQAINEHQTTFISPLSSMCMHQDNNATAATSNHLSANESYAVSTDYHQHHQQQPHQHIHHQQHHPHQLQPLTSARYDSDHQSDIDLKASTQDTNDHHHHHQHHHIQLHHLASSGLNQLSSSSHMLSSSLSNTGLDLNGDLDDIFYKGVDPSTILKNPQQTDEQEHHHQQQQPILQDNDTGENINKQSSSTSSSKTKLNTPRRNAWGNMSYADLISQAINSTNDKRLTLSQIYDWMVQHVPYFKDKGDSNSSAGWKNSVRHNLSLHNRFKRLQNEGTGKSSWWTINPETNIGKCARRRAASMEASKYEKKRGRAKKRAEAVRQGLVSYPSLNNSSLNVSAVDLDQLQSQQQPNNPYGAQQQQQQPLQQQQQQLHSQSQQPQQQNLQQQQATQQQATPQQQQPQQLDSSNVESIHIRQPNEGLYISPSLNLQYDQKNYHFELSSVL